MFKCVFVFAGSGLSIFSAPFKISYKAGLVVMKSLNICLSEKDIMSLLLRKLSLVGYEMLVLRLFLRMLNIGSQYKILQEFSVFPEFYSWPP